MNITRMRTIKGYVEEKRAADPNTSISLHFVRQLVLQKKVSYVKAGSKYLLNADAVDVYLAAGDTEGKPIQTGTIRKVAV